MILSIENHCSIQQQKKIAEYLREIFGDKLDVGEVLSRDSKTLPSPHSLQGKILIKVRTHQWTVTCGMDWASVFFIFKSHEAGGGLITHFFLWMREWRHLLPPSLWFLPLNVENKEDALIIYQYFILFFLPNVRYQGWGERDQNCMASNYFLWRGWGEGKMRGK